MEFNIADLIECVVDAEPDRVALACGAATMTYRALDQQANRLAHHWSSQGVGAGDHVGLHLYNGTEYVVGLLAALKIRAVPININYRYVEDELRYLFDNADLKGLVYQRELGDRVAGAAAAVDTLEHLIAVDDGSGAPLVEGATLWEHALESGSAERDFAPRSGEDLYIIYTGGTTGMPRGVMWRHEDLLFAGLQGANPGDDDIERPEQLGEILRAGREPLNILPAAPLIHGSAQFSAWISMFSAGTVALIPGSSFKPKAACELIAAHGINVINLVGDAMAIPLADELEAGDYDTDTLYAIASAGAVLSSSVKERLQACLPDAMMLNNYGASETGHQGVAIDGPGGRARFYMHGDDTAVLNEKTLEPVALGEVGKLARKGSIPLGYYGDPEKTAATFKTDANGVRWVLPGDFATIDDEGMMTLLGRGSVCINSGGEKVYPEEVEEAFKSHASVFDAVVVGVPDERWGERVTALVRLREGHSVSDEALRDHCRTKVAGYKTPKVVFVVDDIARQPTGKPDYKWAKARAIELSA